MRIWHKDLIKFLPRPQLVAQWRELSAIAENILTKGTLNHLLVNKVMNYDYDHLITYAILVRAEMTRRGYRTMESVFKKICSLKPDYCLVEFNSLFENWHNENYLKICYYNLYEIYLCGGMSEEEFEPIVDKCLMIL